MRGVVQPGVDACLGDKRFAGSNPVTSTCANALWGLHFLSNETVSTIFCRTFMGRKCNGFAHLDGIEIDGFDSRRVHFLSA